MIQGELHLTKRAGILVLVMGFAVAGCAREGTSGFTGLNVAPQVIAAQKASDFASNGIAVADTQRFLSDSKQSEEHPIWSPDGQLIAFQRAEVEGGAYNVWIMKADGSAKRQLTFNQSDCQQPTWTPDGRFIAFREADQKPGSGGSSEFDIGMVEVATGKRQPLIQYPGDDKHPNISADGRWIVFNSERDGRKANLYIVPMGRPNGKPRRLTDNGNQNDVHPNFSKDGRSILYHSYLLGRSPVAGEQPTRIGLVPFAGGPTRWLPLEPLIAPKHPFFTAVPGVITFHATDAASGRRNIYVYDFNQRGVPMAVTSIKNAKHPQVSPDGKWLVYSHKRKVGEQQDGQYDIAIVQMNWSALRKATKPS